ncbi:MAG: AI-2E family transporter, partial [Clostridia bacterium]|nr:AI-2E family transporter [Clostridia bacterium]
MHIADKKKWLRYSVSAAFLIIAIIFARAVWPIIAPFFVAIVLAYVVNPWLKRTGRLGIPLIVSLIIFYVYVFLGIYCLVMFTAPIIIEQLQNLFAYLPQLFDQLKAAGNQILPGNETGGTADMLQGFGKDIAQSLEKRLTGYGDTLAAKVMTLPKLLVFFVLSPFLSYYFLRDKKNILARIMSLIAPLRRIEFLRLMRELDHLLRQFISGYLLISLIISIMSAVFYYIVGLDYALLLGVFMGIAELIPYVGPYL